MNTAALRAIFAAAALAASSPAFAKSPVIKPYTAVAVTLPKPMDDASFDAFRKQLAEAAEKKDRDALAKLVVEKDFFWVQESGDTADKTKPGIDHLARALRLDDKESEGWDDLADFATHLTAAPSLDYKGSFCAPAEPVFIDKDLQDAVAATRSDIADWAYALKAGVEVRAHAKDDAPVIETLGLYFVRILKETGTADGWLKIATPSGKTGYVQEDAIAPLGNDQLCYAKGDGGWKVSGYAGSGEPE